jgi:hypothetical protein
MAKKKKIAVRERVSSLGNQVFVFKLANGRTVEIEFCPHLINLEADANAAGVSFLDKDGTRLPIAINESGEEKVKMRLPFLWFTTPEEDKENSEVTRAVLESLREHLKPLATDPESN